MQEVPEALLIMTIGKDGHSSIIVPLVPKLEEGSRMAMSSLHFSRSLEDITHTKGPSCRLRQRNAVQDDGLPLVSSPMTGALVDADTRGLVGSSRTGTVSDCMHYRSSVV